VDLLYLYRYNRRMNTSLAQLQQRQTQILQQMQVIDRLRRGSLSSQFFRGRAHGRPVRRGPYHVLQGYFQGRKFSERVPESLLPAVQQQVANYKRFQALAEEYVTVTEQITRRQAPPADAKKNSRRN